MKTMNLFFRSRRAAGFAAIVLGAVLLAFSGPVVAQTISDDCQECHDAQYQAWKVSGHPYKLMKADIAQNRPIPLPEGYAWDEISYVIGGYKWKSRYMDLDGYIITQDKSAEGGKTQYNMLTGEWVDYNADKENGVKPYDCGRCHTTNWVANENPEDLTGNQDMLPGIHGTFDQGGIQCIQCHTHADIGNIDNSAEACGACHYRTAAPGAEENVIPASNGFVRHHEQYNEFLASGAHGAALECVSCHDPHYKSEFSITTTCEDCHGEIAADYAMTSMYDYNVECIDCHMPLAAKSGQQTGPNEGDVQSHIFRINTDPTADMFTPEGDFVQLDDNGNAALSLRFACQACHETASLDELALYAKGFHNPEKTLADIGLDPGLTGTWWNSAKDGEGFLLEVAYAADGSIFLYASFYTYGPDGEQTWLVAALESSAGTTANVRVYIPVGGTWGDPSGAETGTEWGIGTFTFPTCSTATFSFTPNQAMVDMGFSALSYDLTRILEPGIACPTFVNNEMAAAMK